MSGANCIGATKVKLKRSPIECFAMGTIEMLENSSQYASFLCALESERKRSLLVTRYLTFSPLYL
jgi:hypothetical protein